MTSTEQELVQEEVSYYIEPRLKKNCDGIKERINKKDKDFVLVIDGGEGSGKSTLAIQLGKYVDPSLTLDRICFTAETFKQAVIHAHKGQCVVYDEAITGLSSSRALSKINNMLKSLMMQMRQKNLLVIVVIPTIFALEPYVAIFRARVLIHTYEPSGRMGYFKVYNRKWKRILVLTGKKTYDYVKINPNFRGRFYGKFALGTASEAEYRKLKASAMEGSGEEEKFEVWRFKFQKLLYIIRKRFNLTENDTRELLLTIGIDWTNQNIGYLTRKIENIPNLYTV